MIENSKRFIIDHEIYSNDYIKFSIAEIVYYKEVLKDEVANYITEDKILSDEIIKKYNIETDKNKYICLIDMKVYKLKFNDYISKEIYDTLGFSNCSINHLDITAKLSDENIETKYEIDYCQLNKGNRLVYSSCGVSNIFLSELKDKAKDAAKIYMLRDGMIKGGKASDPSGWREHASNNDYQEAYDEILKNMLLSSKNEKEKVEKNLKKVKRLEI